jgi:hypothetical protein
VKESWQRRGEWLKDLEHEIAVMTQKVNQREEHHQIVTEKANRERVEGNDRRRTTKKEIRGMIESICEPKERLDRLTYKTTTAAEGNHTVALLVDTKSTNTKISNLQSVLEPFNAVSSTTAEMHAWLEVGIGRSVSDGCPDGWAKPAFLRAKKVGQVTR